MRAIVRERFRKARFETNRRLPAADRRKPRRIRIEGTDVDTARIGRPVHETHRARPGGAKQQRHEIAMRDRLAAADVEHAAVARVEVSGPEKGIGHVIDVDEVADL